MLLYYQVLLPLKSRKHGSERYFSRKLRYVKARVSPVKTTTINRIEAQDIVLAREIIGHIDGALEAFNRDDSEMVLAYVGI